jgi:7,8-dihydro-6-hydroxymethylpterin-pyrophosphokinase
VSAWSHPHINIHNSSNNNEKNSNSKIITTAMPYQVYLAVGSNLGDCYQNIAQALKLLCDANFDPSQESSQSSTSSTLLAEPPTREKMARVITTSWLYQTAPMYVVDQPSFWNGAVHIETTLSPTDLLHRIKLIEEHL